MERLKGLGALCTWPGVLMLPRVSGPAQELMVSGATFVGDLATRPACCPRLARLEPSRDLRHVPRPGVVHHGHRALVGSRVAGVERGNAQSRKHNNIVQLAMRPLEICSHELLRLLS